MAIRRPSIYSPDWFYQDSLDGEDFPFEYRRITVRDAEGYPYTRKSQLYDYSNPPYANDEQRAGNIVAELYYILAPGVITIEDTYLNWRDEWPLRLAVNYLTNCLYPPGKNYQIQVNKEAYAFWVSESFKPYDNDPESPLVYLPQV
jgi:hypothetical protein